MRPQLNHTLVPSRDKQASAEFMAEILGLEPPYPFASYVVVESGNGVIFDFSDAGDEEIKPAHYGFLVTEAQFDEIFARVLGRGIVYWADFRYQEPGEINHFGGGRGVYFDDPSGHRLEILTRAYGTGPLNPDPEDGR